jgi:transposase
VFVVVEGMDRGDQGGSNMCQLHQARLDVWTAALNLPGYEVVHCAEEEDGVRRFSVVPRQIVELCPACSQPCGSWHQKRWLENVLDLPLGGQPVRLKVRVFQYECEHCQRTWTPDSPIVAPGTWATHRLVERAAELVRHSDVANAAQFFGIPEKTLERWYYDYVERQRVQAQASAQPIRSLGIDELSLKKSTVSSLR